MDRSEARKQFYFEHAVKGYKTIVDLNRFCHNHKDMFHTELEFALKKIAEKIVERQSAEKKDIFCIFISFLRSKFYLREKSIRVFALDDRFWLDEESIWEDLNITYLTQPLWELEDEMLFACKGYRNEIAVSDVRELIQMECVKALIGNLAELSRYSLRKGSAACFDSISKTDDFCIMSGEYKGDFDEIYVTEVIDTKEMEFGKYLMIHKEADNMFSCKRYQNQSINNLDLSGTNFTKSHFYQCNFTSVDFSGCSLIKTDWINCNLMQSSWIRASLFDADFSYSDLTGCNFNDVISPSIPDSLLWYGSIGWSGVNFRNTVLKHTTFLRSDFRGSDFRGAEFLDTDFCGARLDRAIFSKNALKTINLTEEQRHKIIIDG